MIKGRRKWCFKLKLTLPALPRCRRVVAVTGTQQGVVCLDFADEADDLLPVWQEATWQHAPALQVCNRAHRPQRKVVVAALYHHVQQPLAHGPQLWETRTRGFGQPFQPLLADGGGRGAPLKSSQHLLVGIWCRCHGRGRVGVNESFLCRA